MRIRGSHYFLTYPDDPTRWATVPVQGNKAKEKVLEIHHIGYWRGDRTDRPGNLITLCDKCHTPGNHKQGKLLYGWKPKVKPFRAETFKIISFGGCCSGQKQCWLALRLAGKLKIITLS